MNRLSLIFPYYENPRMLACQVQAWTAWAEFRDAVEIIIADDCSPRSPAVGTYVCAAAKTPVEIAVSVFRMTEKLRWNQDGARNAGAAVAKNEWLFVLAMDHVVTKDTLESLLAFPLEQGVYYNPTRYFTNGVAYHPAKDIYLMHREDFESVGGYDEDLAGHYGSDGEYHERCERKLQRVTIDLPVTIFTPADCPDAATTEWERKTPEDRMAIAEIRRVKTFYNLPPRRGRIKAEQVL